MRRLALILRPVELQRATSHGPARARTWCGAPLAAVLVAALGACGSGTSAAPGGSATTAGSGGGGAGGSTSTSSAGGGAGGAASSTGSGGQGGLGSGGSAAGGGGPGGAGGTDTPPPLGDLLVHLRSQMEPAPAPQNVVENELLGVAVDGPYIYSCSGQLGLRILDRSGPAITIVQDASAGGLWRCQDLAVDGKWVVVTNRAGDVESPLPRLTLYDVSNPLFIVQAFDLVFPGESPESVVRLAADLYAVALQAGGVAIVARQDATLVEVARVQGLSRAMGVDLRGSFLYVADGGAGVAVIDVSLPMSPVLLGHTPLPGPALDVHAGDGLLFTSAGAGGVQVLRLDDPTAPSWASTIHTLGSAQRMASAPGYLIVADWDRARVYDVTNPAAPKLAGSEHPDVPLDTTRNFGVTVDGDLVYITDWAGVHELQLVPGVGAPDLRVPETAVRIRRTAPGVTTQTIVPIHNDGPLPLAIASVEATAPFTVTSWPTTLGAGAAGEVTVSFTAQSASPAKGTLTITSDDIDEPVQTVELSANPAGLTVGDQLWNGYTWPRVGGGTLSPASLAGDVAVLSYFASYEAACAETASDLQIALVDAYPSGGPQVVGIDVRGFPSGVDDDDASILAFAAQARASYPMAYDPDQATFAKLGQISNVSPLPVEVVLDGSGVIRYIGTDHERGALLDAVAAAQ